MPRINKILGQSNPVANIQTDLYTVGAGKQAVSSTLTICNSGISTTYSIYVRKAGAVLSSEHNIVKTKTIDANDSIFLTLGLTLEATDIITVEAATSNVSFSLFGEEIT